MEDNLFIKMESYAKENYITEIICYLLSRNPTLKKKFLKVLVSKSGISKYKKRMLKKKFSSAKILTQSYYKKYNKKVLIDLEWIAEKEKLFIEIKTDSNEGDKQIQKYLDLGMGYVVYLTPSGYDSPKVSRKKKYYLGHFFWDEISKILKDSNLKNNNQSLITLVPLSFNVKLFE